jgi:hypothetical protein
MQLEMGKCNILGNNDKTIHPQPFNVKLIKYSRYSNFTGCKSSRKPSVVVAVACPYSIVLPLSYEARENLFYLSAKTVLFAT